MAPIKKPASGTTTDPQVDFEELLKEFAAAVALLHKGSFDQARETFRRIGAAEIDEPALIDRARSYARICEARMAPADPDPQDALGLYDRAVVLANDGKYDDALALLNRALEQDSESPAVLYVRASVWALKGDAEAAVADLRRTIAQDPRIRFQAVNDPDFEQIREEPSFIDIIEPTPDETRP